VEYLDVNGIVTSPCGLNRVWMGGHGLIQPVQGRDIHRAFRYTEINLRLP
jgi:hypothetical protein